MAGVSKRGNKWRIWYVGADGERKFATGHSDKTASLRLAEQLEQQARLEREGLIDPAVKTRRAWGKVDLARHLDDWRAAIVAGGASEKHAKHTVRTVAKLFASASVASITAIRPDAIQVALGTMRTTRSPRTCNHALTAVKSFVTWLHDNDRLAAIPRGIAKLKPYSELVDRKRVRRAATAEEIELFLASAEFGPDVLYYGATKSKHSAKFITGPERAALYRLSLATGFRAKELRNLTPSSFRLEGDRPAVVVKAAYSKNGKETVQPISEADAKFFRRFLEGKPSDQPFMVVPEKTAKMLRADLERAGIPYETEKGVLDFHALRHSYVSQLVRSGANIKVVQELARHSTPSLTLGIYAHVEDEDTRKAIEQKDKES